MPPGRREIETHIVDERHRKRTYNFVKKLVSEGRQVYIICPMVEDGQGEGFSGPSAQKHGDESFSLFSGKHRGESQESSFYSVSEPNETDNIKAVKEYHDYLSNKIFPDLSVALVHGKMPVKEKDAAMSSFASGEASILVATTVVEVGVDVANASLIIIENADRFGLSQLHQLRGRVGRGEHQSYCLLFRSLPPTSDGGAFSPGKGSERLEIMKSTNDGFKIAEEDLRIRGPGDFFGSRQHGLPEMRIANFATDMLVLNQAQNAAEELLRGDPGLSSPENRKLLEQIKRLFEISTDKMN